MDETDKLIIFIFSGATILIGCVVITCACVFTLSIKEKQEPETSNNNHDTEDITRVTSVVTNQNENNNMVKHDTQINHNYINENIDNIIQNFRDSLTPDIEVSQFADRNNIMLTFRPHNLIRGPNGEIYDPYQESETDF